MDACLAVYSFTRTALVFNMYKCVTYALKMRIVLHMFAQAKVKLVQHLDLQVPMTSYVTSRARLLWAYSLSGQVVGGARGPGLRS
jgi:hypothetical protein